MSEDGGEKFVGSPEETAQEDETSTTAAGGAIPVPPPVPQTGISILTHKLWIGNLDKRLTEWVDVTDIALMFIDLYNILYVWCLSARAILQVHFLQTNLVAMVCRQSHLSNWIITPNVELHMPLADHTSWLKSGLVAVS